VSASGLLDGVALAESALAAVAGADAAVVVTEWPELRELPWEEALASMRTPLVIDGRNLLDAADLRALGFAYEGVGRPGASLAELPETAEREPELESR
jgi:UDPglucose 6-dehydrogenase